MRYVQVIPVLTKAVQELKTEKDKQIKAIQARCLKLEKALKDLQS